MAKPMFPGWHICERCGQQYGGTHYHCGVCDSPEVTSMYGHYHSGHWVEGKWVKTEPHYRCDPKNCEEARRV